MEKSCGFVVIKKENNNYKVLLIKSVMGHWSYPKGHVEGFETEEETAFREVKEEVNLDVIQIPGFRKVITYSPKEDVIKDVVFFLGVCNSSDVIIQDDEVSDYVWTNFDNAFDVITYQDDKEVLKDVVTFINLNKELVDKFI